MRALGPVLLCIVVAACHSRRLEPEDGPTQRPASDLTLALTVENDAFAGNSDNNDTNGMGISVQTGRLGGGDDDGFLGDWVTSGRSCLRSRTKAAASTPSGARTSADPSRARSSRGPSAP